MEELLHKYHKLKITSKCVGYIVYLSNEMCSFCCSYEFAGRSTLDNSDIDLSKFGSLPKGPPPPKPTRMSPVPARVTSPTATDPPVDAEPEPGKFPRHQSQTAANLAELDDLLNTLNQHQQKFLSDGKLSYLYFALKFLEIEIHNYQYL